MVPLHHTSGQCNVSLSAECLDEGSPILVLKGLDPACFTCFPAPPHLIQSPIDSDQVYWSRETYKTCWTLAPPGPGLDTSGLDVSKI